jgi:acyl-CoA thioester hydrolase
MGVVYHGIMPYFEIGRVEWLRNKGISINGWKVVLLPVVSMNINYKKTNI